MELTLSERLAEMPQVKLPPAHLGLHWEPASENDYPEVVALVSATEAETHLARPSMRDDLEQIFNPDPKRLCSVIVGRDSAGTVQAFGSVTVYPDETMRARADLYAVTSKKWQGRGIGRALLNWQDALGRKLLLQAHGPQSTLPMRIRNTVDSRALDRRMLYAAAGFSCRRKIDVFNLELPLRNNCCSRAENNSYSVRAVNTLNAAQLEQLRALHVSSSLQLEVTEEDALRWFDRTMAQLSPLYSFAALDGAGQVVAYALTRQRQVLRDDSECLSVEICDTHPQHPYALSNCLHELLSAAKQLNPDQALRIYAEDNHLERGAQSENLFRCGFTLVGTRMIYAVEV